MDDRQTAFVRVREGMGDHKASLDLKKRSQLRPHLAWLDAASWQVPLPRCRGQSYGSKRSVARASVNMLPEGTLAREGRCWPLDVRRREARPT